MDTKRHELSPAVRSAPKGRDSIAQGAALGLDGFCGSALKGRHLRSNLVSPFQGLRLLETGIPRALPWAIEGRPFRPRRRCLDRARHNDHAQFFKPFNPDEGASHTDMIPGRERTPRTQKGNFPLRSLCSLVAIDLVAASAARGLFVSIRG